MAVEPRSTTIVRMHTIVLDADGPAEARSALRRALEQARRDDVIPAELLREAEEVLDRLLAGEGEVDVLDPSEADAWSVGRSRGLPRIAARLGRPAARRRPPRAVVIVSEPNPDGA